MARPIITLTTDFGTEDSYVAQMKGVILGIQPEAHLIDITHAIRPQQISQAARCLNEAVDAFPEGTIHIVVVDPGVGSTRRRIGAEFGTHRFIGPDNGLLSHVLDRYPLRRCHELVEAQFQRSTVSSTFHGRDVFAPVAAHWSRGIDLSRFGPPAAGKLVSLLPEQPHFSDKQITGVICDIDHFGNLISNITAEQLPACRTELTIEVAGLQLQGVHSYYAERPGLSLLALLSSGGRLEIAQNGGSAAKVLNGHPGMPVIVRW